ncbi:MAG: hypothetical protein N2C12_08940, partial [Planctomycetales bacterium]
MSETTSKFSIYEAREIVKDLMAPNPRIYWADFLVTITIAFGSAGVYMLMFPAWESIVAFFVAGFALHRLANFMHEVAHFKTNKSMRSFLYGWNIMAGVPMLMPSYFFDNHLAHHNT